MIRSAKPTRQESCLVLVTYFTTLLLQRLRELSAIYLVWLLGIIAVAVYMVATRPHRKGSSWPGFFISAYFALAILISLLSLLNHLPSEVIVAAPRLFLTPLIILPALLCERTDGALRKLHLVFIAMAVVASLSMVYQIVVAPIPWLADPSSRGGLVRVASIFGSLTVTGIANGFALYLALVEVRRPWWRFISVVGTAAGLIVSLQKSALANLALAVGLYVLLSLSWRSILRIAISVVGVMLLFVLLVSSGLFPPLILDYTNALLLTSIGITIGETSAMQDAYLLSWDSLWQRLVALPGESIEQYGPGIVLTGIGLKGGGGAMGLRYHQPHNGIADAFFIGGIGFGITLLVLTAVVGVGLRRALRAASGQERVSYRAAYGVWLLFCANLPFNSGIYFQPSLAALFWVYLVLVRRRVSQAKGRPGSAVSAFLDDPGGSAPSPPRSILVHSQG